MTASFEAREGAHLRMTIILPAPTAARSYCSGATMVGCLNWLTSTFFDSMPVAV